MSGKWFKRGILSHLYILVIGTESSLVQHRNWDLLCAIYGDHQRSEHLRNGVLHDGWNHAHDGFGGVQQPHLDFQNHHAAGDSGVSGKWLKRGILSQLHILVIGAESSLVQHRNRDLLGAVSSDHQRSEHLRNGVLHDGWNHAHDGFSGVQQPHLDFQNHHAAGDSGVSGKWFKRGVFGNLHILVIGAQSSLVQYRDWDLLCATYGDHQRSEHLRNGVLHDGWNHAHDGFGGIQQLPFDFQNHHAASDSGVSGRELKRRVFRDIHAELGCDANTQPSHWDLCEFNPSDDRRSDVRSDRILHH